MPMCHLRWQTIDPHAHAVLSSSTWRHSARAPPAWADPHIPGCQYASSRQKSSKLSSINNSLACREECPHSGRWLADLVVKAKVRCPVRVREASGTRPALAANQTPAARHDRLALEIWRQVSANLHMAGSVAPRTRAKLS